MENKTIIMIKNANQQINKRHSLVKRAKSLLTRGALLGCHCNARNKVNLLTRTAEGRERGSGGESGGRKGGIKGRGGKRGGIRGGGMGRVAWGDIFKNTLLLLHV